jgi:hypothetical protein
MNAQTVAKLSFALCAGSAATLIPKILLRQKCDDSCGGGTFNAPIYTCLVVFVASSLGLVIEAAVRACGGNKAGAGSAEKPEQLKQLLINGEDEDDSLNSSTSAPAAPPRWWSYRRIILPGVFAVFGTLSQLIALMFISAAVLAGLRGVFIIATALLSYRMGLKDQPLSRREWHLIAVAAVGALAVGAAAEAQAAVYGETDSESGSSSVQLSGSAAVAVGLAFCVAGYLIASAQVAIESIFLTPQAAAPAAEGAAVAAAVPAFTRWEILGVEGLVGIVILIPGLAIVQAIHSSVVAGGGAWPLEVPETTWCCLSTSSPSSSSSGSSSGGAVPIVLLSIAYGASSLTFNAALLALNDVGPNFRVFVFTARGLITWVIESALAYSPDPQLASLGVALTPFAALTLAGFACLIGGGVARTLENMKMQSKQ